MATCNTVQGSNLKVRVIEEVGFGESLNSGFDTIFVKSNSVSFKQNSINSELLTAGRSPSKASKGNIEVGGKLEVAVDPEQFGFWLKMVTGKVNTQLAHTGTLNLHTFNISDSCIPSFQIEKSLFGSDITYKAIGLKANSLNFEVGGEGELIAGIEVIGKNEYKLNVQADSVESTLALDYLAGVSTIEVVSAADLSAGEVITFKVLKSNVAEAVTAGSSTIKVATGEGALFAVKQYISINDTTYQIKGISGDYIYLSRKIEKDITLGTSIFNVSETNKILSIAGNVLTLEKAISQNLDSTTDSIYGESKSEVINKNAFNGFDLVIDSSNGKSISGNTQSLSFNYNNNSEGIRLINDKGSFGKVLEGKADITCELTVLLDPENANLLEEAKIDSTIDLKLEAINENGERLSVIMPKGTLNAITPEISSPGAILVKITFTPFKETSEAITFELLNSVVAY